MSGIEITNWPGTELPTFSFKKGHMRIATAYSKGNTYWMIGFSNIPVFETTMEYEQKPDETIIPIFSIQIKEPEAADLIAATFKEMAEKMRQEAENGTDDSRDEPGGDVRGDV